MQSHELSVQSVIYSATPPDKSRVIAFMQLRELVDSAEKQENPSPLPISNLKPPAPGNPFSIQ